MAKIEVFTKVRLDDLPKFFGHIKLECIDAPCEVWESCLRRQATIQQIDKMMGVNNESRRDILHRG